jgi:MFS family permease
MPILFSSEESSTTPHLPFKFMGGFDLSTKTIGFILSGQGFLQMIAQIFIFPVVNRRLGSLTTFRIVIMAYPLLYFFIPYLALVPRNLRGFCIFMVLVWKVTAQSLSYPSQAIMLANSAPSKKVLGTLNGFAASAASLARAFGPTIAGLIHSVGLSRGYSGFSWWSCAVVATIGAGVSLLMTEPRRTTNYVSHDISDEELALVEPLLDLRTSESSDEGKTMSEGLDSRESSLDDCCNHDLATIFPSRLR